MIRFACRCGHRFELPDDQAGGSLQCGQCGLLNDVPTLDDLPHLGADGTYGVSVPRPVDDPIHLARLGLIYSAGSRDAEGDEIDLRISMNELAAADAELHSGAAVPLAPLPPDKPTDLTSRPRYDPETGERVVPLELKRPAGMRAAEEGEIPLAKRSPALSYASVATDGIRPRRMLLDLLMPGNLIVMFMIFFLQFIYLLVAAFATHVLDTAGVPPEIVRIPLLALLCAHYGNVVEDAGPFEHDDLQRPMRDVNFFDDLIMPLGTTICAFVLCYLPLLLAVRFSPHELRALGLIACWLAGSIVYPAMLLTLLTSGSLIDLSPGRLMGMIRACGRQYWISAGTWTLVGPLLYITTMGLRIPERILPPLSILGPPILFIPLIGLSIYLAHFFHWHLGLLYRANSVRFPWVFHGLAWDRAHGMKMEEAAGGAQPQPRQATRDKLRALREAERRRRVAAKTTTSAGQQIE